MARTPAPTETSQSPRRSHRVGHRPFVPRSLAGALMLGTCLALPLPLAAQLPVGANVVSGTAAIATLGNQMTVTNSPNAIINWQGFSIGAGSGVHFAQQSAASQVLNRVTGKDPSNILGSLTSNGGVWLINPHGVLFGKGARVNVGGLVASTLDIADADFLANRFRFDAASPAAAGVLNQGEIRTSFGGRAWLLGEQVRNEGLVEAPGGEIVLAAGKGVEIVDSGTPNVVVKVRAPEGKAVNLGSLIANGGRVDVHAGIVNQDGIVHADSIGVDTNGDIVLQASGDLTLGAASETRATGGRVQLAAKTLDSRGKVEAKAVRATATDLRQQGSIAAPGGHVALSAEAEAILAGLIDASDPSGAGGLVEVTGDSVQLTGATVDASGGTQGGTVHLGGGWQGGGALPHAREVLVDAGSVVRANGGAGQGGEIVLWSTGRTNHQGLLEARTGGRIEVSSQGVMTVAGEIDPGPGGEVLLDPKNLFIEWLVDDGGISVDEATFGTNASGDSSINPDTITAWLNEGFDVTLQANNDLWVRAGVYAKSGDPGDLTLQAGRNISFDAQIAGVGNLTAVAGDPGALAAYTDPGTPTIAIAHICGDGVCGFTLDANGLTTLAAIGGDVINNAGDDAIAGRFLIYAADPATTVEGFSEYNKHYNQPYTGAIPSYATDGNWFLYSIAPTITVTPDNRTITYGDAIPAFARTLTGFIDGDTTSTAGITGTPSWGVGGAVSTSGNPTAGLHDVLFTGGLASSLGYLFADDAASTGELAIDPREITASVSANDKVYDGTTNATLTGISTDILPGDLVTLSGIAAFRDENVGVDKPVDVAAIALAGADADNYVLLNDTATAFADITPRVLAASLVGAVSKIYDATTTATVTDQNLSLSAVVAGDGVGLAVTGSPFYDTRDVGTGKAVTAPGLVLTGVDAGNYSLSANTLTANIGTITPATLTYVAESLTAPVGVEVTNLLTGAVAGFLGGDTIANATTGTLAWTTSATIESAAGSYPIAGSGLSASNYVLIQAAANATALRLVDLNDPESPLPFAVETAVQGERTAADLAQAEVDAATGYVLDRTPALICAETPSFETLNLSGLSREEAQQLLESRKECKKELFADAIQQLEKNPNLADVSLCASVAQAQTGTCRLTDAQREQAAGADGRPSAYRVRVAKLPQIERKVAVLFGIDQYVDQRIPSLDNAISDADAVGRVLSEKLGYEVRVVRNATKADIVRALNELATEVEPTDSVVVYYAGHGDVIEKTGIGYWLPSDASAEDAKQWLSNDDISRMLSSIKARQLAMISDSCYSGAFAKEQKVALDAGRVRPETVLTRRSVIVMSSGGDEPVADSGRGGHSIFAWYLMQDLGKVNNWQPGTALFPSLQSEVSRAFPQTPQYGAAPSAGHEQGGDYLFEFRQLEKGG